MWNLHKYYYKDYFSPFVKDPGSSLTFEDIIKDEELNRLSKEYDEKKKSNESDEHLNTLKNDIKNLKKRINTLQEKNKKIIEKRNELLTKGAYSKNEKNEIIDEAFISNDISPRDDRFSLKISYPGLVTGVGIDHEVKIEGEYKLGVHFDWTRGMSVVYGSSVKGVLRNYFMSYYEGDADPGDLMMEIFSGVYGRDIEAEKKKYKENWGQVVREPEKRIYKNSSSIYQRDIFFDAVITHTDSKGRILCSDSITPHGDDPLKNPTPLPFMKIAPGCTLEFRFKLHPSTIPLYDQEGNPIIENGKQKMWIFEVDQKKALFIKILTNVGIGAKTNVGYGQLEETSESK